MGARYKVTAGAVVLPTRAGSDTYMYRGTELDAAAFAQSAIEHAVAVGLIAEVDAPTPPADGEVESDGAKAKSRRPAK